MAGIEVASGATLTLENGTQIQGGTQGGTGLTLTIDSTGELAITSGGATLDGMFVTDNNAITGIDVSGAALTLNDGTVISGGTMTVESTRAAIAGHRR